MDINTIITTWIASIVTGVIVVVITTGIGKIVSIWWKNRTFLKNRGIIELVYIVLQSVVKPGITGFFKIDLHIKCYIYLS